MSSDPLLEPFQLKHLTLKNRIMISSHEPAYVSDGMRPRPATAPITKNAPGPVWR